MNADWKEQYEEAADEEDARYRRRPVAELLTDVKAGRVGEYATIWRVIGERGELARVGWELMDFLRSPAPYLSRYHCAAALLRLLGSHEFEAVQLSALSPELERSLARVDASLVQAIGVRRPPASQTSS